MTTYLAARIQQEGTSKRRKTSKGFYRKTHDYIKAYSPAYDLIREHMNNFLANDCDVTQTSEVTSRKLLKKINRAASLLVSSLKIVICS